MSVILHFYCLKNSTENKYLNHLNLLSILAPPNTNYGSRSIYNEGFDAGMIQSDGNFYIRIQSIFMLNEINFLLIQSLAFMLMVNLVFVSRPT